MTRYRFGACALPFMALLAATPLWAFTSGKETRVEAPAADVAPNRSAYTDTGVPWCIMGMDCMIPSTIAVCYFNLPGYVVRSPVPFFHYPFYYFAGESKEDKLRVTGQVRYYGPRTTIRNYDNPVDFDETKRQTITKLKEHIELPDARVVFPSDYGNEFLYVIPVSLFWRSVFNIDNGLIYLMKAPTKITIEVDINWELRIVLRDLIAGPDIILAVSTEKATKPSKYEMQKPAISCGNDRIAVFDLSEFVKGDTTNAYKHVYVYLLQFEKTAPPALLHSTAVSRAYTTNEITTSVTNGKIRMSFKGQKIHNFQPKVALLSDKTVYGTPTLCGSSDAQWHVFASSHKYDTGLEIEIPLYLSGQKVLVCGTISTDRHHDITQYTIPIATRVVRVNIPPGVPAMIGVDATGKAEIVLRRHIHPLSEILLVENNGDAIALGMEKTPKGTKAKDVGNRDLKFDENSMSSLGHVSLDPHAIFRRIEDRTALPLSSTHHLTFPPAFSYILGDRVYWSVKMQFFPQMLFNTAKAYTIFVCDRWKRPHCLAESDFDEPAGIVIPNRFIHSRFNAKWNGNVVSLTIVTAPFQPTAPHVKLVKVNASTIVDYDQICNTGSYISASIAKTEHINAEDVIKDAYSNNTSYYFSHNYDVGGIEESHRYCVCYTFEERKKSNQEKTTGRNATDLEHTYPNNARWYFMTMLNSQMIAGTQRVTFRSDSDTDGPVFTTTGVIQSLHLSGIYMSEELTYDCSKLYYHLKRTTPEPSSELQFEDKQQQASMFWLPLSAKDGKNITENPLPQGFWLSLTRDAWEYDSSCLVYKQPLGEKKNNYKVCVCYKDGCVSGGNMMRSPEKYIDVTRFVESSLLSRLAIGSRLCVYGKGDVRCFDNKNTLKSIILSPLDVKTEFRDIKCVLLRQSDGSVLVVRDSMLYIYNMSSITIARIPPAVEHIYSFTKMAFVLLSDGSLYCVSGDDPLAPKENAVYKVINKAQTSSTDRGVLSEPSLIDLSADLLDVNTQSHSSGNVEVSSFLKPTVSSVIFLQGIKGSLLKLEIVADKDPDTYNIFYVDEFFNLHHSIAHVSKKEPEPITMTTLSSSVSLGWTADKMGHHGVTLRATTRTRDNDSRLFVFVHRYGSSKMTIFHVRERKMVPYGDMETNSKIIDFVLNDTTILGLTRDVSLSGEISQSLVEIDLGIIRTPLHYSAIPPVMYIGEDYLFEPVHNDGKLISFTAKDNVDMEKYGLKLDPQTGYLHVNPKILSEKLTIGIEAVGHFSTESATLSFVFTCSLGSYLDKTDNKCVQCSEGTFWSPNNTGETCLKCTDFIKDSTTKQAGSKSSHDCVCPPGTFLFSNECHKCPEGTTSEIWSSTNCPVIKVDSQVIQNISVAPQSCNTGSYLKGDTCVTCPIGFYCYGQKQQPIKCSVGMTTVGTGAGSTTACVCNAGYEWVSGKCTPCSRTSYKEDIGNTQCTPCPSEDDSASPLYTPALGATSQRQCTHCKEGFYYDANKTSCVACPVDSFCPGKGSIPLFCPSNTLTPGTNSTSIEDCLCIKGFGYSFTTRYVFGLENLCTQCPINTFQHMNGTNMECMPCPKNTYTAFPGASSLSDCVPGPGYYSVGGDNLMDEVLRMESLRPGDLNDATVDCVSDILVDDSMAITVLARSLYACVDLCKSNIYCRFAYYTTPANSVVYTVPLLSGDWNYKSYRVCKLIMGYEWFHLPDLFKFPTDSVSTSVNRNNVLCMVSRPRLSLNFNRLTVFKCPMNHYCPGGEKFAKFRCPTNSVTLTTGASHIEHCMCLPGYELSNQVTLNSCLRCKEGFYKDTTSNARCSACPNNMTTLGKGAVSAGQCICSVGYYAAPTNEVTSSPPSLPAIKNSFTSIPNVSGLTHFMEENFNLNETNSGAEMLRSIECKPCPEGYVCPGKWLQGAIFSIHNPPISCPEGSSVPGLSQKAGSVAKCICKPGYGSGKSYGDGMFVSCQKCAPGTFSESYATSSCSGRCNDYAITFPGASSFKDCFCLPGRFMTLHLIDNEYKFVCTKCSEGTVCPGGFRDPDSSVSRSDDPQTAIFNHTPQYPRMGYMAIFKRKSAGKRDTLEWKPDDHRTYIIHPPAPSQFGHYEHVSDIHACVYPNRCKGSGASICMEGSNGYLCGKCTAGYDTRFFQSICTKCGPRHIEAARLLLPRIILLLMVFMTCYINHYASCDGDFSVIAIFKIWYMFVFSLVPLGMQQFTTSSSLRHFYNLHHHYFYKAITFFMHVERLGCWERNVRGIVALMNSWGLPKSIIDGSKELSYINLWYMQRILALAKPLLDVLTLCFLYLICRFVCNRLSSFTSGSPRKQDVETHIMSLCKMARSKSSNKRDDDIDCDDMTLQTLDTATGKDSVVSQYLKSRSQGYVFLVQQVLLLLTLHVPGVVINSLSMLWCTPVRYKRGPIINVLMHLPDQVCDVKNPLFKYGRLLGITNLAVWFGIMVLLFFMLSSSNYSPRSWNTLFMSGCDVNCRWWDVVHLSRQWFLSALIVCHYSMDPKGDTEYMRTTCYLILHFVYVTLHLSFSPYDDRNNARFYHLESTVLFSNLFMCIFIQGSYLYDFSDLDGFPIVVSLLVHMKIVWTLMVECGNIKFATRKTNGNNEFICMVLDFLPSVWEHRHANVYYDYKNDNIVLESSAPRGTSRSLYDNVIARPLIKVGRLLGLTSKVLEDPNSSSYSLTNRDFLMSCIHATIEKSNMFTEKVTLSNAWFYFITRYVFWYCHCLHTHLYDKKISSNALFHKVVFLHFFPRDHEFDATLAKFLVNFPLQKLSSHGSVHHNGKRCDGKCGIMTNAKKRRRVDEVAESLLVECLFDTLYDLGPVSLTEFYFGLLSLNQLRNSVVLRVFEAFRIHSFFLKDEKEFHLLREADNLNESIASLKRNIEGEGEAGTVALQRHHLASQIDEVESDITQLNESINREHQIIMAGRAAAAAALNLHLGLDNFVTENLSHDDILAAISSIPSTGDMDASAMRQGKRDGPVPTFKLGH